jgi:hypothetical protein
VRKILVSPNALMLAATESMFAVTVGSLPSACAHVTAGFQFKYKIVPGRVAKYCSSEVRLVIAAVLYACTMSTWRPTRCSWYSIWERRPVATCGYLFAAAPSHGRQGFTRMGVTWQSALADRVGSSAFWADAPGATASDEQTANAATAGSSRHRRRRECPSEGDQDSERTRGAAPLGCMEGVPLDCGRGGD